MIHVAVIASSPIARAGLESLVRADPRFSIEQKTNANVLLVEIGSTDKALRALEGMRMDAPATVLLVEHPGPAQLRRLLQSGARAVLRTARLHALDASVNSHPGQGQARSCGSPQASVRPSADRVVIGS